MVGKFLRGHLSKLDAQVLGNSASEISVGGASEEFDVRHDVPTWSRGFGLFFPANRKSLPESAGRIIEPLRARGGSEHALDAWSVLSSYQVASVDDKSFAPFNSCRRYLIISHEQSQTKMNSSSFYGLRPKPEHWLTVLKTLGEARLSLTHHRVYKVCQQEQADVSLSWKVTRLCTNIVRVDL